eukprot:656964_1
MSLRNRWKSSVIATGTAVVTFSLGALWWSWRRRQKVLRDIQRLSQGVFRSSSEAFLDHPKGFSILTFNCLSKRHCSRKIYPEPTAVLDWDKRRPRLIEILKQSSADILCLQEVELPSFKEDFGDFSRVMAIPRSFSRSNKPIPDPKLTLTQRL